MDFDFMIEPTAEVTHALDCPLRRQRGQLHVRERHEAAHLAYLADFEREILIAGGLRDVPGGPFIGGLWVMEVVSRDRAVQLVECDPYFIHGGRRYRLHVWGKALAEKQVTL